VNVLHLTLSLEYGGRRKVVLGLARGLAAHGVDSQLAVLASDPGPPIDQPLTIHCLGRSSLLDLRDVRQFAQLCRCEKIDLIHTHDAASQWLAAKLRLRHPRKAPPALMTFHRSLDLESRSARARLRNRVATALTGAVVGVSEERRRHYIATNGVDLRKVVAIPNSIDTDKFRPDVDVRRVVRAELVVGDDTVVLGAVGHYGREKGLDVVLKAFRQLLATTPNADLRLFIAGGGSASDRERLERLAVDCGGRVTFLGQRDDLARLYQAFDLLLHAPRQEAFGLVVAEAMAAGVPVVATRVGGVPEIVSDGQTGMLVDAESPVAMCEAAHVLIESTELRRDCSRRAVEVARANFNLETQARRYLGVYNDVLAERLPHGAVVSDLTGGEALAASLMELQPIAR
jgi:glycosyltransferase involved in cell wall biosynthesis